MNPKVKKLLSFLFILISVSAVIIIAFSNRELGNAWDAISRLSLPWIGGLLFCWFVYGFFEAMGTWNCLYNRGHRIRPLSVYWTVLIGMYYSNITPSAAGGQPMQVNSLRKAGIPVAHGTLALTIRFVSNQFMICMIGLALFLLNRSFVYGQLDGAVWAVRIGWLINFASVPLVLLAAFRQKWIRSLAAKLIRLGAKLRIVKNPETAEKKTYSVLNTYHEALSELVRHPGEILAQLLCSGISLLGLTGSVVFTYYAFGQSGTGWVRVLTLSCLLFVSASYTPLPGASGAQEGGFLLYFRGIFKDGTIGLALLIWRFFTYYLFLITGVFAVLNEKMLLRGEIRRAAARAEETGEAGGPADSMHTEGAAADAQGTEA